MKAENIVNWLNSFSYKEDFQKTCDTFKTGSPDVEVTKVGVAMFATPSVIKKAQEWGAELLIVHEPLFYNHYDARSNDKVECAKAKLLEESKMAVYRFHDHPHCTSPDMIAEGELKYLALDGEVEYTDTFDLVRVKLKQEISARDLAKHIEQSLNIKNVRIAGEADKPIRNISCMFGAPGGLFDELKNDKCDVLITGEVCEWALCEYARDASEMGYTKAVLALGHAGSERAGMMHISELLGAHFKDIEVDYFECGEVYSYTDKTDI